MRYHFYTADVFTDRIFGGNQLAVFPDATGLDTEQMQQVTREFNFSETVFVLPPDEPEHTRRLRIFTPNTEIPFAGHPTIGTAHVLAAAGEIALSGDVTTIVFEEGVGPIPVTIRAEGDVPAFVQLTAAQCPEFGPPPPSREALAAMLSLEEDDLLGDGMGPCAVTTGVPYLFVPLQDRTTVARAELNRARWRQVLADYWTPDVYVFAYDAELPDSDIRARMFAPAFGIEEDPATGSAATALAGYLAANVETDGTLRWRIEQGFEMGRPSILDIEADKDGDDVTAVRVGGQSVLVTEGTMEIPDATPS